MLATITGFSITLGAEYSAVSKKLETGGKIAGAIVAIAIFFMVVQP
jgi:hypothetical protein